MMCHGGHGHGDCGIVLVLAVRAVVRAVNVIVAGVLYLSFCSMLRIVVVVVFVVLWWWCW